MKASEIQDAADLSRAISDTESAGTRQWIYAGQLRAVAIIAASVALGGLIFRSLAHQVLGVILVGMLIGALLAYLTSRACRARGDQAFERRRWLYSIVETKGYPLDRQGRYLDPEHPPADHRPSPYGYDPFRID